MDNHVTIQSQRHVSTNNDGASSKGSSRTSVSVSISVGDNGRFRAEIDGVVIITDGFIAIFHDGDWFSTIQAPPARKGLILTDLKKVSRKNDPRVLDCSGDWAREEIPDCIGIGDGTCIIPDFRAWFEFRVDGLASNVYAVIDGFFETRVLYIQAFWPEPTKSDSIAGFINIGRPPVASCTINGDTSKKNAILAFGNYHENEKGGELLAFKGGMEVWATSHYGTSWDEIRSRPPICAMIARAGAPSASMAAQESYIAWMTVDKWGARTVMHVGETFIPGEYGNGIKVLATRNRKSGNHQHLPGVIIGIGTKPRLLMGSLAELLAAVVARPGILRKNKSYPPSLEYLGWCTWNALGERRHLSGDHVLDFWRGWAEKYKDVPLRTMIIDDGWQHVEHLSGKKENDDKNNIVMASFRPNAKFPALSALRRQIEKIYPDFKYLGVWHTIHGWWGGSAVPGYQVLPGTKGFPDVRPTAPVPAVFPELRSYLPDPVSAAPGSPAMRFYDDWYAFLRSETVDFTKVDSQNSVASSLAPKSENDTQMGLIEIDYAARALHAAKEAASSKHAIPNINCMCMVPTSWQHWTGSAVSRCSGDFCMGDVRYSSFLMHQAALNQLWYSHFVWGDWDMWNSKESRPHFAEGMAICRAVSGGPIYVTDYPDVGSEWVDEGSGGKPGDWLVVPAGSDAGLLKRLAHPVTGQIARLEQPAQPNHFSLWNDGRVADPGSTSCDPLVINNKHHVPGLGDVGYVAIVNVTAATTRANVKIQDLPDNRRIQLDWDAPPRECTVTREMLIDEPEHTHGVDRAAASVLVHQVATTNAFVIQTDVTKGGKKSLPAGVGALPLHVTLAPMQAVYYQVIPIFNRIVPLGTPDLFNQTWVFESISVADGTTTMDLKFPARLQVFSCRDQPPVEAVRVWDDAGEIPYIPRTTGAFTSPRGWTREGCIDAINSGSCRVHYSVR
jgi:hypothetical protein